MALNEDEINLRLKEIKNLQIQVENIEVGIRDQEKILGDLLKEKQELNSKITMLFAQIKKQILPANVL